MAKEGQVYLPPAFEDLYAGKTTDPETTPVDEAASVSIAQARVHGFGEETASPRSETHRNPPPRHRASTTPA